MVVAINLQPGLEVEVAQYVDQVVDMLTQRDSMPFKSLTQYYGGDGFYRIKDPFAVATYSMA